MPNTFDHRGFAQDGWGDMAAALAAGLLQCTNTNGLDAAFPTGLTYAYGAGAGTTPTAFTTATQFSAGSNAFRGIIYFNTGSSTPAGGVVLTVTFPSVIPIANLAVVPYIYVNPNTQAAAAWTYVALPTMTAANCTGFTINTTSTITASQGSATAPAYSIRYLCLG